MPPLLADFFHTGACKPICEKFLTRPIQSSPRFIFVMNEVFSNSKRRLEVDISGRRLVIVLS